MDKLEYIPGDLVTYNGNIVIIENSDGYYATYYDEDEFLQEVNVNAIEGIPLTPAILEKNGWKRDGKFYCMSTKRAYLRLLLLPPLPVRRSVPVKRTVPF